MGRGASRRLPRRTLPRYRPDAVIHVQFLSVARASRTWRTFPSDVPERKPRRNPIASHIYTCRHDLSLVLRRRAHHIPFFSPSQLSASPRGNAIPSLHAEALEKFPNIANGINPSQQWTQLGRRPTNETRHQTGARLVQIRLSHRCPTRFI